MRTNIIATFHSGTFCYCPEAPFNLVLWKEEFGALSHCLYSCVIQGRLTASFLELQRMHDGDGGLESHLNILK